MGQAQGVRGGKVVPDDAAAEHESNLVLRRFAPFVRNRSRRTSGTLLLCRLRGIEAGADASDMCSPDWSAYSVAQTAFCTVVLLPTRLLCLGVMLVVLYVRTIRRVNPKPSTRNPEPKIIVLYAYHA
jgi:hypothetical protein